MMENEIIITCLSDKREELFFKDINLTGTIKFIINVQLQNNDNKQYKNPIGFPEDIV